MILESKRLKKGMDSSEAIVAMADGIIGLIAGTPEVIVKRLAEIMREDQGKVFWSIYSLMDALDIVGSTYANLFGTVCGDDVDKFVTLIYALEVAIKTMDNSQDDYLTLERVQNLTPADDFPFERARDYVIENHPSFPPGCGLGNDW